MRTRYDEIPQYETAVAGPFSYRQSDASHTQLSRSLQPAADFILYKDIAPGWITRRIFTVLVERDKDGWYVASNPQFAVYGEGVSFAAARHDYIRSLIEYYQLLKERQNSGDPYLKAQFRALQHYLCPE